MTAPTRTSGCDHAEGDACWRCCEQCNVDRHLCPGCGESLNHGQYACRECGKLM